VIYIVRAVQGPQHSNVYLRPVPVEFALHREKLRKVDTKTMTRNVKRVNDPHIANAAGGAKRGRPKKKDTGPNHIGHSYWVGDVFIVHGWCWTTDLVEVATDDGGKYWEAVPLCLGSEGDILPVLRGQKPVPVDIHPRRRVALLEILGVTDQEDRRSYGNDTRTKRFLISQRASRSFRSNYRYRA